MNDFYDDSKFTGVKRHFFGHSGKVGGGNIPHTVLNGSATSADIITRFYPKGPIDIIKFGFQCVATASAAANATGASDRAQIPMKLYKSSSNGTARTTVLATSVIKIHPVANTLTPLWSIGSKETMASSEVEAGRFLTIYAATAESNDGTAAAAPGTTMVSGSFAFFVDFIPKYDADGRWDANQ